MDNTPRSTKPTQFDAERNDLDLISRYSEESEILLWNRFADCGLLEYEQLPAQKYLTDSMRILDIGCGCGREAIVLAERGMKICCLDICPRMVQETLRRASTRHLSLEARVGSFTQKIPFTGNFDAALLLEQTYHHIIHEEERIASLVNIKGKIAPDGFLLLAAFNEGDIITPSTI